MGFNSGFKGLNMYHIIINTHFTGPDDGTYIKTQHVAAQVLCRTDMLVSLSVS